MKKKLVSYAATKYFSKAVADYLQQSESIRPYYQFEPALSSFPKAIESRKSFPTDREILNDTLIRQHAGFKNENNDGKVFENIEALKQPNTFTVTTAHQPNLFLGPLYLIYKIVSTINLAKKLNGEFTAFHFVPVFWMGSEDHDKEELNHIHLFGKTFTWNTDQQGAFGRMDTSSLASLIEEIKSMLGESEQAKQCSKLLEDCYLKEKNITAATRKIIYQFFSADGLVIIDGDDAALKKLFIPLIEKEIFQEVSYPVITESNKEFSKHYASQVTPREINFFYLDEGIRQRIVKENEQWKVLNTSLSFSEKEMRSLIHDHPERFSPNVVLRPIYQETVLPDLCFLGGGAEITYWMQLKSLFTSLAVPFPIIMLRNSVLCIEGNIAAKLHKLAISEEEIFLPADTLVNNYLLKQSGDGISLETEKKSLENLLSATADRIVSVDATLKGSFEAEKVKMLKSLDLLEEKLRRATKKKEEVAVQKIQAIKEKLFPDNGLQERYDNFLPYYLKYGSGFFNELKSNLDPLEMKFTVLSDE